VLLFGSSTCTSQAVDELVQTNVEDFPHEEVETSLLFRPTGRAVMLHPQPHSDMALFYLNLSTSLFPCWWVLHLEETTVHVLDPKLGVPQEALFFAEEPTSAPVSSAIQGQVGGVFCNVGVWLKYRNRMVVISLKHHLSILL
jgi:hypothetical protein